MDRQSQDSDIISNLPEIVTENILSRLLIRDAVRTSVLSRYWRYKWTTVPRLAFDAKGAKGYNNDSTFFSNPALRVVDEEKLVKVIYRILCQHEGPIRLFFLVVRSKMSTSYPDVDNWIRFLSKNGIRVLALLLFKNKNRGFSDLTCLRLRKVSVDNEGFDNLISKCLKLSYLSLTFVDGLNRLNIDHAPKLESLSFHGMSLKSISLNDIPCLVQAYICFCELPDMNENTGNGRSISLINNLNWLSNLTAFATGVYFLTYLAQGSVRNLLPPTFGNLNYVDFYEMIFEDIDSLSSALGLLTTSPNLIHVSITADSPTESAADQELRTATEYLEGESSSIGCFMKLKYVEMKKIVGVGPEMELIKLILVKSPSLELMKISLDETTGGSMEKELKILKELIQFPRASKTAKIIYQDKDDHMQSNIFDKSFRSYWKTSAESFSQVQTDYI